MKRNGRFKDYYVALLNFLCEFAMVLQKNSIFAEHK